MILQTGTPSRWVNTIHLPVEMRAKPTISLGAADSGSGGGVNSHWDSSSANNSKRSFYQGANHSSVSASYWKFDAEL